MANNQRKGTTTYIKCLRLLSSDVNGNVEAIVEPEASADDGQDVGFEDSFGTAYAFSLLGSILTRRLFLQSTKAD